MLSANTAWLVMNTPRRRWMTRSSGSRSRTRSTPPDIVNGATANIVQAADPTGLLPTWDKYVDKAASTSTASATTPTKAKNALADAGYKTGGDGFVNNKDGSPIKLTVMVPTGWSDWEASRESSPPA